MKNDMFSTDDAFLIENVKSELIDKLKKKAYEMTK